MNINEKEYGKLVKKASPPSTFLKDFVLSFFVGGVICVIGELLSALYEYLNLSETVIKALVPCTLIFLASFLTGIKLFEKIARHAGAGTLVPITGFANAVTSPAIEFRNEGYILGVGAKIFGVAGPVILYGTVASVIYGIILYIFNFF